MVATIDTQYQHNIRTNEQEKNGKLHSWRKGGRNVAHGKGGETGSREKKGRQHSLNVLRSRIPIRITGTNLSLPLVNPHIVNEQLGREHHRREVGILPVCCESKKGRESTSGLSEKKKNARPICVDDTLTRTSTSAQLLPRQPTQLIVIFILRIRTEMRCSRRDTVLVHLVREHSDVARIITVQWGVR